MAVTDRMIVPLREGAYRLRYAPGRGDVLVISFASTGRRRGEMPGDEFRRAVFSVPGAHGLFVSDGRRTWLNAPDLVDDIRATVRSLIEVDGVRRVVAVGNTLGGYSALVAGHHFPVDVALAFSPQFSPLPDLVPEEVRWRHWRSRLPDPLIRSVDPLPAETRAFVFHADGRDAPHLERFPVTDDLDHFVLPGARSGRLGRRFGAEERGRLLRAAARRDRPAVAAIAAAVGAVRRVSP